MSVGEGGDMTTDLDRLLEIKNQWRMRLERSYDAFLTAADRDDVAWLIGTAESLIERVKEAEVKLADEREVAEKNEGRLARANKVLNAKLRAAEEVVEAVKDYHAAAHTETGWALVEEALSVYDEEKA